MNDTERNESRPIENSGRTLEDRPDNVDTIEQEIAEWENQKSTIEEKVKSKCPNRFSKICLSKNFFFLSHL